MDYNKTLSWFGTKRSQNWKIVRHILTFGKIYNHECQPAHGICKYTSRISEIRKVLNKHGLDIVAFKTGCWNEYYYKIKEL